MTINELRAHFNTEYGISNPWPASFEVDAETFANVCIELFKDKSRLGIGQRWSKRIGTELVEDETGPDFEPHVYEISFYVGRNGMPLFKGVEIILKK